MQISNPSESIVVIVLNDAGEVRRLKRIFEGHVSGERYDGTLTNQFAAEVNKALGN